MGRTFVIGDIHGGYRALRQCLERSGFDYENDHLISLGDVCDGWPETSQCIDELLRIRHLTYVLGNHDQWALDWMRTGLVVDVWHSQGGDATIHSYPKGPPLAHVNFLKAAVPYYLDGNRLFVHAGILPRLPLRLQDKSIFLWDRNLARMAIEFYLKGIPVKLTEFDEVYIGHTPVSSDKPVHAGDVWLMDTGAGWSGVLSIMNIDTKEVFTSDTVPSLYPGVKGRTKRTS